MSIRTYQPSTVSNMLCATYTHTHLPIFYPRPQITPHLLDNITYTFGPNDTISYNLPVLPTFFSDASFAKITSFRNFLTSSNITPLLVKPFTMMIDSAPAIQVMKSQRIISRSRHLDIPIHYSHEYLEYNHYCSQHIDRRLNLADMMTKPLSDTSISNHWDAVRGKLFPTPQYTSWTIPYQHQQNRTHNPGFRKEISIAKDVEIYISNLNFILNFILQIPN